MALVLAAEALRKFGGDSLAEVVRNRDGYVAALGSTPSSAPGRPSPVPAAPASDDAPHPARRDDGRGQDDDRRSSLARRLGWAYLDSDAEVEARHRRARCPRSSPRDGEAAFRRGRGRGARHGVRRRPTGRGRGRRRRGARRRQPRRSSAASGTVVWLRARADTLARRAGRRRRRAAAARRRPEPTSWPGSTASGRPLYAEVADAGDRRRRPHARPGRRPGARCRRHPPSETPATPSS